MLGFDPYQVNTFKDTDVRNAVALQKAKSNSLAEVQSDDKRWKYILSIWTHPKYQWRVIKMTLEHI